MLTGPDVSRYQPTWSPATGDDFVFIKCSEGRTVLNSYMPGQVDAGRARGLIVGFYHYLWPDNALGQAAFFAANALAEPGDLLVCDWERNRSGTVPSEADKDAFLGEVRRLLPEHRVGLYVNASMWNASHKQPGDFLWVAHYGVQKPNISEPWTFWQWTDNPIDQNFCRFTTPESLRSWARALIEEEDVALTDADKAWIAETIEGKLELLLPRIWKSKAVDMIKVPTASDPENTYTPASVLEQLRRLAT